MTTIYHLVPQSYHLQYPADQPYYPATFDEEGFIHCTAEPDLLQTIANLFFAALEEPLLVYELDTAKLTSPLKYESPTPAPTDTTPIVANPISDTQLFPHIYGPINRQAISNIHTLQRNSKKQWVWLEG